MVTIDGSYGEGGGQILRTALTLSALTGKPLKVYNIRAGRKNPGLRPQHIMGAKAVSLISEGRLEGAEINSTTLTFYPGVIKGGDHSIDVGTAGSTGMVFQTILPLLVFADKPSNVMIKGGTHVSWSPPVHYIKEVFLKRVSGFGVQADLYLKRWGFYPEGGGEIEAHISPCNAPLKGIKLTEKGIFHSIKVLSAVSNLPRSIGERQKDRALQRLREAGIDGEEEVLEVKAFGKGTFLFILATFEDISAGFSSLGEKGRPAEKVADEAVDGFLSYISSNMTLDPHLADQICLYTALAQGISTFTTSQITRHLLTNIWVIERFLPVRFEVSGEIGEMGRVSVKGVRFWYRDSLGEPRIQAERG